MKERPILFARALAEADAARVETLVEEHTQRQAAVIADLQRSLSEAMTRWQTALFRVQELTQERDRLRAENRRLLDDVRVLRVTADLMERQQRRGK